MSSYTHRLNERMRKKRAAQRNADAPEPVREQPAMREDTHPSRYPAHTDPDKGQVYGGECNRTHCSRKNAIWWNIMTHGLYCPDCGPRMNFSDSAIVAPVKSKPTLAQMQDKAFQEDIQRVASRNIRG